MSSPSEKISAREFVWVHRLRQRIILERIVLSIGTPDEQNKAKQFLDGLMDANPELFSDLEQYTPDLFDDAGDQTPELFDNSEYSAPRGRKTALKLPQDILWEEKTVRRAVREFRDLFHPCDEKFSNAMKGLQYLNHLFPDLFERAKEQIAAERDQILDFEVYCKCDCATKEESLPANSFSLTDKGRFQKVSGRIAAAKRQDDEAANGRKVNWGFFLERIREVAPEMVEA